MKTRLIMLSLMAALFVSMVAPSFNGGQVHAAPVAATSTHSPALFLDKTRFVLHAGVAFFAIHHEYKRFQEGYFSAGAAHRTTNIIKAAAVLLIGVHEAKVAYGIAVKSNSPTLHALASPIQALTASMDTIRAKFAQGKGSATDIQNLNSAVSTINATAAKSGFGSIHDISAPLPSGA